MKKKSINFLEIKFFRNHLHTKIELDSQFNLFHGENGEGKTSLLEAIYFLSHFKTLKGNPDTEMIYHYSSFAHLMVQEEISKDNINITLKRKSKKELLINNNKPKKVADIFGKLPSISMSTQDLDIIYGEPLKRRHFLDLFLSQYSFVYLENHTFYKRYLNQRNALLKHWNEFPIDITLLETLEEKIVHYGCFIINQRITFLNKIHKYVQNIYKNLGGQLEEITLVYLPKENLNLSNPDEYKNKLLERRTKDKILNTTHFGPHRDDIDIYINSLPARYSSSQGQQRTALLSLKLACYEFYKEKLKISPILLLDDMFSDLDRNHREHLVEFLQSLTSQVIFTCTETSLIEKKFLSHSKVFNISKGKVIE